MSSVLTISDAQFEQEVLNSEQLVLAYFWANWCGPCRLVSPSIDWASATYGDRLKVVKMEVDPNPQSVKLCRVEGVPALRFYKKGELLESLEGAISKQQLATVIENHL